MLNLTLKENEGLKLGQEIEIKVIKIKQNKVELGTTAPEHLKISRTANCIANALTINNGD